MLYFVPAWLPVLALLNLLIGACSGPPRAGAGGAEKLIQDLTPRLTASPALAPVLSKAEEYRVQVLFSRVIRDQRSGTRHLERWSYRLGAEYFYPASSIKLAAAIALFPALESLNSGRSDSLITLDSPATFGQVASGATPFVRTNASATRVVTAGVDGVPGETVTLRRELTKLFAVSDNEAFNRLYDVIGHGPLNASLHEMGFGSVVLNHRLSDSTPRSDQRATVAVTFAAEGKGDARKIDYVTIPQRSSALTLVNSPPGLAVGKDYMKKGALAGVPMDFGSRNGVSLTDLQDMLVMLFAPDINIGKHPPPSVLAAAPLLEYLSGLTPRTSGVAQYELAGYGDDYCKLFLPGLPKAAGEQWRVFNKIGQAYGFTIDNAWIVNRESGEEYFLSAVIYTNADGVLNDDRYEYATVAEPFMAALARELCVPAR